jgi:hypothetical protein
MVWAILPTFRKYTLHSPRMCFSMLAVPTKGLCPHWSQSDPCLLLLLYWYKQVCTSILKGTRWRRWLRHCATSRKVASSRPDEVNAFFSIYLIIPAILGSGVHSAPNKMSTRRKIMFLGNRSRPVRRADNLSTICEPTV